MLVILSVANLVFDPSLGQVRSGESASSLLAALGLEADQTNVVCATPGAAPPPKERQVLHEGDVIIGINGEPCVGLPARTVLAAAPANGPITFTLLRPKGRIALSGAAVVPAGPRKGGGHLLSLSVSDANTRHKKYLLVCADERLCAGWIASIKEAIAAAAMEEIKTAVRTHRNAISLYLQPHHAHGSISGTLLHSSRIPVRVCAAVASALAARDAEHSGGVGCVTSSIAFSNCCGHCGKHRC